MGFRNWFQWGEATPPVLLTGYHICPEPFAGNPEILMRELVDMIDYPRARAKFLLSTHSKSLPFPLTRFWWTITTPVNEIYDKRHLEANLDFVEQLRENLFGKPTPEMHRVTMRWETIPDETNPSAQSLMQVRWTESQSQYQMAVSSTMCLMTNEVLEELSGKNIPAPPPVSSGAPASGSGQPNPYFYHFSGAGISGSNAQTANSAGSQAQSAAVQAGLRAQFAQARRSQAAHHWANKGPASASTAGRSSNTSQMSSSAGRRTSSATPRRPSWPTPQEYHEALQNPHIAFPDPELGNGSAVVDALGLPRVASGAFASVYRMQCRGRDLALRCFLLPLNDQAYRYSQLSNFILADNLTYTVGFEFQMEGIRIHGNYYPVLKMEWVDGLPFHLYLESIRRDKSKIRTLLERFRKMSSELQFAGIAHGDLQHGNILVRDGEIFLVDYDGMFVPSLSRQKSNELGHANYQHPARKATHFADYLDNFSAWVFEASLFSLQEDPSLWEQCKAGDECLLFRKSDYQNPEKSKVFQLLRQHKSAGIRRRAEFLAHLTTVPLEQVPWLGANGAPQNAIARPAQTATESSSTEPVSGSVEKLPTAKPDKLPPSSEEKSKPNLPDWLRDIQ